MRVLILDTYYPGVFADWKFDQSAGYAAELRRLLEFSFGTADFYSRGLNAAGCEASDIIVNATGLQELWAKEHDLGPVSAKAIALQEIAEFRPDVLFMQNLGWFSAAELAFLRKRYLLTGQCSCPMPSPENVKQFHVLFTSFPHYVERFQELGVKAVFNPLAFDPIVLSRLGGLSSERSGCVFVGGVGAPSHWKAGMETLERVATSIPEFTWYGYGYDNLPNGSALRRTYRGTAWGLDSYRVMARAAIVINRHGEVAERYANNMRMFEATGVGAMLLTDHKSNLGDYFTPLEAVDYATPADAVDKIRHYLRHDHARQQIANAGFKRTLRDHTYGARMKTVANALQEQLATA